MTARARKISETLRYLEGKNFEMEYFMDCSLGGEDPAIQYFMDFGRQQIRFYVNYYLPDEKVQHVLEMRTIHHEEKYDVELKCPVCGEWEHKFINIPNQWDVLIAPHNLTPVFIPEEGKIEFDTCPEAGS